MNKSKWDLWKEKNKDLASRPWDFINPKINKVDKEVFMKRYEICLSCDKIIKSTKQCKECKCFMNLKAKIPHSYCPIGKWSSVDAID
jgi:hypothetical protein